jgi:hypothetical protein
MADLTFGLSIDWEERHVCILGLPEKPELRFTLLVEGGFEIKGEKMALTMTAVQQCGLSVAAVDAKGNPAQVEGVTFTSSDPAILTVEVDPGDETIAVVKAMGPTGNGQVTVTADADLGEGIKHLTGILDVTIMAAEAVSLSVAAGVPEDQPAAP